MYTMIGDTIVTDDREIGIVENRSGNFLTVRFPDNGNRRDQIRRGQATPLAEFVRGARSEGKALRLGNNISLVGDSTLADLVALFGYSTGQMRRDSLQKVLNQLNRAGLEVSPETDRWGRDDRFKVSLRPVPILADRHDDDEDGKTKHSPQPTTTAALPDPFWPTAFGLEQQRELEFLRAFSEDDPILCLLYVPAEAQTQAWIQGTWEGIMGWAYRAAQRFCWRHETSAPDTQVCLGSAALLHTYLKPSALNTDAPRLHDTSNTLNLITIKRELELPTDFARLSAVWPGPIFQFKPDYKGEPSADIQSINRCLLLAAGMEPHDNEALSPLSMLNWARAAYAQLMTWPVTAWGGVMASNNIPYFKGSNESSVALTLKAHLAQWVKSTGSDGALEFEYSEDEIDEDVDETSNGPTVPRARRIDLFVKGLGCFEVESMRGSGPMESFYHKKIFSRVKKETRFFLIVPTEAILWAGPFLSDLAHHLREKNGCVRFPSADGAFLEIDGKPLVAHPIDALRTVPSIEPISSEPIASESLVRLRDVAGYQKVRSFIDDEIIWPEKHGKVLRATSRSSGLLFFGPPGCGKSRWARAIAVELEQEVRLLAPSDLRGAFIGWGQIMIREQFDWLAENENRMLIIDELDAVARSRQEFQMHSDEKACVNELLVQLDRVLSLGRLMVATTNFIGSMDEAVMRSGRFGRFIPVPPPDLQESVAIVDYYLKQLDAGFEKGKAFRVRVPDKDRLEAIIQPLYNESRESGKFYCGADLEAAVNRAYVRSARRVLPDRAWSQESPIQDVHVTEEELRTSLIEVPRSIQADALDQFLQDVHRFCDRSTAESLSTLLRPSSAP
jgi:SpoVK/Ycf46/Vps4 family AAA+-type ATPase